MSKMFLILFVLLMDLAAHAFFVPILSCSAQSKTHNLFIKQEDGNINLTLENRKPYSVGDTGGGNNGSKKYRLSSSMSNTFIIHKRVLGEFYHSGDAQELVANLMYQRPEFIGDEDLVHGYASSLVNGLVCH